MASADLTRINTNIQALNALNALNKVNSKMSVHQLRLATGKRINSAADDAAGFTIASKLKVKSEGLGTALDNIGSAKNLMTVSEGHLTNIQDILTKMKSKAQQAANGTLGSEERSAVLAELQKFNEQINSEVQQAQWAGTGLLSNGSGAAASDLKFQIGTGTSSSYDELSFNIATSVWTSGNTTFDSSGLDVVASSTTVKTASETAVATSNIESVAAGTSSTYGTYGAELASGDYTVEVSTVGAGNGTATAVTIRLKDASGNYLSIDADGTASAGEHSTALSTTISAGTTVKTGIDLGNGITIDLDLAAAATAAAATSSAEYTISYAQGGNSVSDMESAQTFMGKIDTAINKVSEGLSYIGAQINRMSFQEESLSVARTNTESAYSRIVDADMAWEQLEATKMMILQQTATAMLAQANQAPQSVLSLFG